jgi:hypothetical protein
MKQSKRRARQCKLVHDIGRAWLPSSCSRLKLVDGAGAAPTADKYADSRCRHRAPSIHTILQMLGQGHGSAFLAQTLHVAEEVDAVKPSQNAYRVYGCDVSAGPGSFLYCHSCSLTD